VVQQAASHRHQLQDILKAIKLQEIRSKPQAFYTRTISSYKSYDPVLARAVGSNHLVATGFNPLRKKATPLQRVP